MGPGGEVFPTVFRKHGVPIMMFYGQNVAAFRIPWEVDAESLLAECQGLELTMLLHNMHLGNTSWLGAPLKAPLGDWKNTDATVFRHHPEMEAHGAPNSREARKQYMARWQWTELCAWTPKTMEALLPTQDWGTFSECRPVFETGFPR